MITKRRYWLTVGILSALLVLLLSAYGNALSEAEYALSAGYRQGRLDGLDEFREAVADNPDLLLDLWTEMKLEQPEGE